MQIDRFMTKAHTSSFFTYSFIYPTIWIISYFTARLPCILLLLFLLCYNFIDLKLLTSHFGLTKVFWNYFYSYTQIRINANRWRSLESHHIEWVLNTISHLIVKILNMCQYSRISKIRKSCYSRFWTKW